MATLNQPLGLESGYGPIESVIHGLDQGLTALGRRSIVACSADSAVSGEHFVTVGKTLGRYCAETTAETEALVDSHLALSLQRADQGDVGVVHMHQWSERVGSGAFAPRAPVVVTLHVPGEHSGMPVRRRSSRSSARDHGRSGVHYVAISQHQRLGYAGRVPIARTIHHGIDTANYPFGAAAESGGYLFHIGRFASVKGQDTAIEVARRSGRPLVLAGYVQDKAEDRAFFASIRDSIDLTVDLAGTPVGSDYFETVMRPILSAGKQVMYIGELDSAAKKQWYRHALATLFPVRWAEPFGMVLIESMACGTPVVAFRQGAVPEVVQHARTGFVVDSTEEMIRAIGQIDHLDRTHAREHVCRAFSLEVMATRYAELYDELAEAAVSVGVQPARRVEFAPVPAAVLTPG